jgi:putative ABC transport system permease protein
VTVIAALAWKNLAREKTRLAISVGGVAFAVLLILLLRGLYAGFTDQATAYIRSVEADVWVAEAGTPGDFFHSVSILPLERGGRLAAVEGVEAAIPFVARSVVFRHEGKDLDFLLVGVDPSRPVAGPPEIERGRRVPQRGELVVDRVFARNAEIDVGDRLRIGERAFDVVGVARGGNAITSQFAWTSLADASRMLGVQGVANYFLVEAAEGASAEAIAARIRAQVPGTKPLTEDEFVEKNIADLTEGFLPIVLILVIVAFVIGTAVIGLTIYTATLEKQREYGVLKAIGFSNRRLFGIVFSQSLAAGTIGFALGAALTFALGAALERLLPSFVTSFGTADVALVAAAALLMSVLSSFIPARPVARLDPAEVFRV